MSLKASAILKYVKVNIPKNIFDRSDYVKYLVVNEWQRQAIDLTVFNAVTSEKFNAFVREHVNAYLTSKKMPPPEIEVSIMNIADDLLSGREPVLRAGDYISLQNCMKGTSPK